MHDVLGSGFDRDGDQGRRRLADPSAFDVYLVGRLAPGLGEHTRAILAECGYSAAEVDALAASGLLVVSRGEGAADANTAAGARAEGEPLSATSVNTPTP